MSRNAELRVRVWGSLSEPRSVTLIMVAVYALVALSGVYLCSSEEHNRAIEYLAAVLMILGGGLGVPSAWRGSWWLEGPAALLTVLGVGVLSVFEAWVALAEPRWPHHTLMMTLVIGLFFITRAMRVWPEMYRPGVVPTSQLELARARMQGANEAERRAALNCD